LRVHQIRLSNESLANHVCVEGVWGCCHIEELSLYLDAQAGIGVGEVADGDDDLLAVAEDNDGRLAVVAAVKRWLDSCFSRFTHFLLLFRA
jgi:hypothetical protein